MDIPNSAADLVQMIVALAVGAAILLLRMLLAELRAMREEEEYRHEDAEPDPEARGMGSEVPSRRSTPLRPRTRQRPH